LAVLDGVRQTPDHPGAVRGVFYLDKRTDLSGSPFPWSHCWITEFRSGNNATQTIAHLSSMQEPTLIIWGCDDRVSPMAISLTPLHLIPNCELHIFPKCGHWAMIECKDRFERLVHAFIESNIAATLGYVYRYERTNNLRSEMYCVDQPPSHYF